MTHPYQNLPAKAFWRTAVANKDMLDITDLWLPKFEVTQKTRIATFGSCFAQHFGRALRDRNYSWVDGETAPKPLATEDRKKFGYEMFSARTGNIYTTSLLKQWISWALGYSEPPSEVWEKDGRFYDPFRPNIEPNGFQSVDEVVKTRTVTINALNAALRSANLFVFTLGLTESWSNSHQNYEYPLCPGTVAGEYSEEVHTFQSQGFSTVLENLRSSIAMIRSFNRNINFLLTVSPVPLTATYSGKHVLVSTSASKAILRAVAETLVHELDYVDYFPSFEIINSPVFKGRFFEENMRSVSPEGVSFVMENFFKAEKGDLVETSTKEIEKRKPASAELDRLHEDVLCEEELLSAFVPLGKDNETI